MIETGKRYLITTDHWFYGPDGDSYRAVWGMAYVHKIEDSLGFTPVRPSTNWYAKVGSPGKEVVVAGCNIHYAVRCEDKPIGKYTGVTYKDESTGLEYTADRIYIAE